MKLLFVGLLGVGSALATSSALPQPKIVQDSDGKLISYLFEKPESEFEQERLTSAFLKAMEQMKADDESEDQMKAISFLLDEETFSGYKHVPAKPMCDTKSPNAMAVRSKGAAAAVFPGGVLADIMNFNLAKVVDKLAQTAATSAASSGGVGGIVAMQAIMMASMMIQGVIASAIHILPPHILPVFKKQPLQCLPMLTGMNCFGTILHKITVTDFIMATATDMMVKGYISSFPQTYADKVGYTPDPLYKACFTAFMGMHCAAIFPKCSPSPVSSTGNDPTTLAPQRVPMCFFHCIATLVACPGFWIDDIIGPCEEVTMGYCSYSVFWRYDLLPPQYISIEGSQPSQEECPSEAVDITAAPEMVEADAGAAGVGAAGASGMGGAATTDVVKVPTPGA